MSSSSASSSSRTPSPAPTLKASKKSNSKDKGKHKSTAQISGHGRNEGVDPTWAYKPPADFGDLKNTTDAGDFDWDTVEGNEDVELWLIRVPESVCSIDNSFGASQYVDGVRYPQVKPKYLENTSIDLAEPSKSARAGTISRKLATFDIWSVGDDDDQLVGGEEIKGLSCLLPRKSKKGKLYPSEPGYVY